jgi:hypothetical protein
MIRLHYGIADTIDVCLEKLGAGEHSAGKAKVRPSRRASFEVNKHISEALADIPTPSNRTMPEIVSAALNERLAESDSTSLSESSY